MEEGCLPLPALHDDGQHDGDDPDQHKAIESRCETFLSSGRDTDHRTGSECRSVIPKDSLCCTFYATAQLLVRLRNTLVADGADAPDASCAVMTTIASPACESPAGCSADALGRDCGGKACLDAMDGPRWWTG